MNQIELLEMRLAGLRLEMTKINKTDQDCKRQDQIAKMDEEDCARCKIIVISCRR